MAAFLLVPLSIAAGVVAGRIAARNAVREEMNELRAMLRAREAGAPTKGPLPDGRGSTAAEMPPAERRPAAAPEPVAPVVEEGISPEVLMVLTAAVAAFLGKKARIRRASLAPSPAGNAWAQQGRVFVQGSHALNVQHR